MMVAPNSRIIMRRRTSLPFIVVLLLFIVVSDVRASLDPIQSCCIAQTKPPPSSRSLVTSVRGGDQSETPMGEEQQQTQPTTNAEALQAEQGSPPTHVNAPHQAAGAFLKSRQLVERQYWKRKVASIKEHLNRIRNKASKPLQLSFDQLGKVEKHSTQFLSTIGSATLAVFANKPQGLSFLSLYALSLLGSSVGFYLFLYFISIGYALGIALPLIVALAKYSRQSKLSTGTILHTLMVVLWGLRSLVYFVWREYVNWPALHRKVVRVNATKAPSLGVKILCWFLYSFVYVCMLSPCWFRLEHNPTGRIKYGSLLLQISGLLLESIADYQKSTFKASQPHCRYEWCHVGVWKLSTHPNYAGEWLFWLGTLLGTCFTANAIEWIIMFAGFSFITVVLRGAVESLDKKHWGKYGSNPEFVDFRQSHTVFGPAFWQSCNKTKASNATLTLLNATETTNSSAFDEKVSSELAAQEQ